LLRLLVEPIRPWVDSEGRTRSRWEEFGRILDERALLALDWPMGADLIPWHLAIVSDDLASADYLKPLDLAERVDGPEIICHAVGHENAADHFEELAPLWTAFLARLRGGAERSRFVLAQHMRHPEGYWCDLTRALEDGWFELNAAHACNTTREGHVTTVLSGPELSTLLASWWPNGLGMLGGVAYRSEAACDADRGFERHAFIPAEVLGEVDHAFVTTSTFDELGLAILSRSAAFGEIQQLLREQKWTTGMPVDLVSGLD
jgi:hypothetical protein